MSRWFRLDDDVVNDPKVQSLPAELFKAWINILCIASKHDGTLPPAADIAFTLRTSTAKTERLLADLKRNGLVDTKEGVSAPHNWDVRQRKSDVSTERVKRFREQQKSVSETVSVTAPDTEKNRAETERKKDAPNGALFPLPADSGETAYFQRFKEVCGQNAGGLGAKLLKAKGSIPAARAVIEQASLKQNPREYVGGAIRGEDKGASNDHDF